MAACISGCISPAGPTAAPASPTAPAAVPRVPASATSAVDATAEPTALPPTRAITQATTQAPTGAPTGAASATAVPPRVLILSIDGLRPDAVLQEQPPHLLALAERGAYTWEAQTVRPPATLPAHASMLCGCLPARHGVIWNDYLPDAGNIRMPTVLGLAEAAGRQTVMVVGKEKFAHLLTPENVDTYVFARNGDQDVADQALAALAPGFDLALVHLPNMDYFGHLEGWMSPTYLAQLHRTDEAVGRLLAALPADTVVMVTADHGGHGLAHGANIPEDMTIPWIMAGPGVRTGHRLTTAVSVMDTAATAAHLLGLALPDEVEGVPVLEALAAAEAAATPAPGLLNGAWAEGARQEPARSEMPAAVLDGLIYVPGGFGGEAVFQVYDPQADAWRGLAALPEGRHHLMAAALDGRVYVFGGAAGGGWAPAATAWAYDPQADAWSVLAPMPEARLGGAAVALNGRLYVVGGVGGSGALLAYDPAADVWQRLASLQQPREHVAAAALNGEIYALGGRWEGVGELASVEIYDPMADAWRDGPPMNAPRAGFNAAVLHGHILAAGGEIILRGSQTLDSFEVYDPAAQAWAYGPPLPHPLHGVPAASDGARYYLLGGSSRAGAVENAGRVLIYTP